VGVSSSSKRVEVVACQRVHDGFFKLDTLTLRHERFDGSWTPPLRRELFIQRAAVAVLPYDPRADRVVLVEQFRTGALPHPGQPWLIEAVAGLCEAGETAEAVARREVREETGLEVGRLARALTYHSTPGGSTERVETFVAEVTAPAAGGSFGLDHEHEDIRTHVVNAEAAFAWADQGRIIAANGLIPILWLRLNRDRLRSEWAGPAA
jgi:ADP-ribose pyrophosphatase